MIKKTYQLLIILLLPLVAVGTFLVYQHNHAENVRAYGHLLVDMGVLPGQPIFTLNNFLPGNCETRQITVTSEDTSPIELAVRSDKESQLNNLPDALNIKITEDTNVLYERTLADFFADSDSLDGIPLSILNPQQTKTYNIQVCFDPQSENDYQHGQAGFDLIFGEVISPITLPAECSHLKGVITQKIEGTSRHDRIRGTSANELIIGNGGNDNLDGGSGIDCIIGGSGNDQLDGGSENDVVIGLGGNDQIDGGSGDDRLYGGDGNDKIEAGSGNDYLDGGNGNDNLRGRSGTDTCTNGEVLQSCEL